MANAVTKYAARKMLGKQLDKYQKKEPAGSYDPYYTYIEKPSRWGGKPKKVKVKKQIPDYLPDKDAMILAKVRQRAYALDCSLFNFLGLRFGWSSVIGLVPAFGDFADGFLAWLLVCTCSEITDGLGWRTKLRMYFNIILDLAIGFVPILGDLGDAYFRANSRNVRLLEKLLEDRYAPAQKKQADAKYKRDSGMDIDPAAVFEDLDNEDSLPSHHRQDDLEPLGTAPMQDERRVPPAAARPVDPAAPSPSKAGHGWFGGFKKQRQPERDLESQRLEAQETGVISS